MQRAQCLPKIERAIKKTEAQANTFLMAFIPFFRSSDVSLVDELLTRKQ